MSSYAATYHTQSAPEVWETTSYTVRRLGCSAWEDGIASLRAARDSAADANRVCASGHRVFAQQRYVGESLALAGKTRTVER